MAKTQFLTYYIHLTDPDAVATYQARYPQGVNRAPYHAAAPEGGAAIEFSAPWRGYSQPAAGEAPFSWTPWNNLGPLANPFPIDVATFQRHTGGFFGIGGTTVRYYWMGQFVYVAPAPEPVDEDDEPLPPAEIAPVPQRRFIEGFERATTESGGRIGPDASRHVGGWGLKIGNDTVAITRAQDVYGATLQATTWERFYIRLRRVGSAPYPFITFQPGVIQGAMLTITPSGQIGVEDRAGAARTALGTAGQLTVGTWTRVDVLLSFNTLGSGGSATLRVYLDGVLTGTFTVVGAATGFGNFSSTHTDTVVGNVMALTGLGTELDFDDWFAADVPVVALVESLTSPDWLSGTRIALARPLSFGPAHDASWSGDVRLLMQREGNDGVELTNAVTSSTSAAICEVTTDASDSLDSEVQSRGVLSLKVLGFTFRGAASGSLGYSLAGAAAVSEAVTEGVQFSSSFTSIMYRPTGLTAPVAVTPLRIRATKGVGADAAGVHVLLAEVELTGTWGPEDVQPGETVPAFPAFAGQHNAPYARTPWALDAASAPISPVIIIGGLYSGNSTGQDLSFRAPIHFFMARRVAASADPCLWWSTMIAPHRLTQETTDPLALVQAVENRAYVGAAGDDAQQQEFLLRIAGSDADINASGSTYQYIAVSDPGMRFMCNGALLHNDGASGPLVTALANADFTPEFLLAFEEALGGGFTGAAFIKTLGNASGSVSRLHGTTDALSVTFGAGSLTTDNTLHSALNSGENQLAYSAWRRHDGNNDPGEAAIFSAGYYDGDGNATMSVICGTAGLRPLFAIVVPENTADGYMRDPSHLTTASIDVDSGVDSATAIKAGLVDGFQVGISLNANGIRHHYFVLWGSATAGNGGWSINGEFTPVEADSPADGLWPDDPDDPPDDGEDEEESPFPANCEPDLDTVTEILTEDDNIGGVCGGHACEYYTRALFQMALSKLGISKQFTNLATDNTEMAAIARAHAREDVNATLRDFDWPWATAYADLVLVGGTETVPVNADWQYSYRAPQGMMKARRIVGQADQRRAFDPDPPPFRKGQDASGELIYTNAVATDDVPVVLEYTARNACPAFWGDALFREALSWRFAASLAQPLCKDSEKQKFCLGMYKGTLLNAEAPAANEQEMEPDGDASWIRDRS